MLNIHLVKPKRNFTGEQWKTNSSNKKRLAKDFNSRCGYCDDLDMYSGGYNVYHVEHFAPKEKFKELQYTYDNLLYSCPYCNISKSNKWVGSTSVENILGEEGFIDPCDKEYDKHLKRTHDGKIVYLTPLGLYMYKELKLYLQRHDILYNLERIRLKRNELKEKIELKKNNGQNYDKLEYVYKELCVIFCEYYDLIFEDDLIHS
ncbi:HNH endonuclease [Bacillus altitudinis]|uniref:HNH endonuclease n=1 Tax=Bacillus TaxID=1386 RepID=UPI00201D382E|nr:HNH endonuclease [Bacillus altitudinis]MCL6798306.1 HNH endonuclease [Bacillus altitudinis]